MNIETNGVKEKVRGFECPIKDQLQTSSVEYFSLALLRWLYPKRYENVVKKESPDFQGDTIGIEITQVDLPNDIQADKEFSRYCRDSDNRRKETISKRGKGILEIGKGNIKCLDSGGVSIDLEIEELKKQFDRKIEKSKGYNILPEMELVLLKTDPPVQEWRERAPTVIKQRIDDEDNIFQRVYVIYPHECACIEKGNKEPNIIDIDKDEYIALKIIGRMTAEGEITLNDREWR